VVGAALAVAAVPLVQGQGPVHADDGDHEAAGGPGLPALCGWLGEKGREEAVNDFERAMRRREEAEQRVKPWLRFLGLHHSSLLRKRVREAAGARLDHQQTSQTLSFDMYEIAELCARVTADTLASQIEAAADGEQDFYTIRWVVAGLRCPAKPFCTGCIACQTVTAPTRTSKQLLDMWGHAQP